jgi:hypothetical protein
MNGSTITLKARENNQAYFLSNFNTDFTIFNNESISDLLATLQARATYYENQTCTTAILDKIEKIQ